MGSTTSRGVDLRTFAVHWIRGVGSAPRHLVLGPAGHFLYATLNGEGRVAKVDLHTGEVVAKVATGSAAAQHGDRDDGRVLYVVNYESNTVSKVRTSDMARRADRRHDDAPDRHHLRRGHAAVWVACYSGSIEVFKGA